MSFLPLTNLKRLLRSLTFTVLAATLLTAPGCRQETYLETYLRNILRSFRSRPEPKGLSRVPQLPPRSGNLLRNIIAVLESLEVDTSSIRSHLFPEDNTRELQVAIPRGLPAEHVVWLFHQATEHTPYRVADCSYNARPGTYEILYNSRRHGSERVRLVFRWAERYYSRTGVVAFLIQQFGFEADKTTVDFLSFPEPLSVSLTANEDKSNWTARIADHYRKEVVILIPLENKITVSRSSVPAPLMVHHSEEQILGIVNKMMEKIPNYAGFCGLGGSRFLEDSRVTRILLGEVKKAHGYFVDTRATPHSLVPQICEELRVPYRQVDIEIEPTADVRRVEETLATVIRRAQRCGTLLVTAAPTAAVITGLRNTRSLFARNGIKLVYVSEVVRYPEK